MPYKNVETIETAERKEHLADLSLYRFSPEVRSD